MQRYKKHLWIFFFPAIIFAQKMEAEPLNDETGNKDISTAPQTQPQQQNEPGALNKSTDYIGNKYLELIHSLDMLLSQKSYQREKNDSHLSLVTAGTFFENGDIKRDFRIRAKAHFPGTSERLRLFIETDPDESFNLDDRSRPTSSDQRIKQENSTAGIEYSKKTPINDWKRSISLGGNFNGGINPLVRYRVRKFWKLQSCWMAGFRQDFWHQSDIGWGETSHAEFIHPTGPRGWFKIESAIEIRDDNEPFEYMNSWRINQQLFKNWTLGFRLAFFGEGKAEHMIDDRAISSTLIYKIPHKPVFLYLTPEIYFADEFDYNSEHSLTFKLRIDLTD